MNVNFGLFPPLGYEPPRGRTGHRRRRARAEEAVQKTGLCARALADLEAWRRPPCRAPPSEPAVLDECT